MRKTISLRLVSRVLAPFRPDGSFETRFDDVEQTLHAALAFRSHGCRVRIRRRSLSLVVTPPRPKPSEGRAAARRSLG